MQAAGMVADDWQRSLLASTADRVLMLCGRQVGKSTTAAVLAAHRAAFWERSTVLIVGPGLRQAQELFAKALSFLRALAPSVDLESESALRVELSNRSRIFALPGGSCDTVRGYTASLVVIDEAARVADSLFHAVTPMTATARGRTVALSTPSFKWGWFHKEWTEGVGWERFRVTSAECSRIPKEFLNEQRRTMPARVFEQEFNCEFSEPENAAFDLDLIEQCVSEEVRPLFEVSNRRTA
ncbi:MAG: hypothetical protein HY650_16685 [Acidobacteria bacterium]|nr:hypothetical protein [Acidobacteriota bacterium]